MGDPAGIGPEVVRKALASPSLRREARVIVVGDLPRGLRPGRIQAAAGRVALASLDHALTLLLSGEADALVTAPVSKQAINRVNRRWVGHTEYLGRACRVPHPVMMFVAGPLRVSLVTTHQAIARLPRAVTPANVAHVVSRTVEALRRDFGLRRPRVAVAALNPHAGEGGLFGTEERRWLAPLVRKLHRRLPARLTGPLPVDTLFAQAARGAYDAVVAMYHDQALIPVKLLAWEQAVNVTLGLPFVRTSPAHGTAFDLVGTGRADPSSMRRAIELAIQLARRRACCR